MDYDGFQQLAFRPKQEGDVGFVYVLLLVSASGETPFYVGQTKRPWGRLDDYYWAEFSACTDFRVGEAVRHLCAKGFSVIFRYRQSANPLEEERKIISTLRKEGKQLLNCLDAFDYQTADEQNERTRVQDFMDRLLQI